MHNLTRSAFYFFNNMREERVPCRPEKQKPFCGGQDIHLPLCEEHKVKRRIGFGETNRLQELIRRAPADGSE